VAREPALQTQTISLRREMPARILHLARPNLGPPLDEVLASFQAAELPVPGRSSTMVARSILGIGHGRWWLIEDEAPGEEPSQGHLSRPTSSLSFGIAIDIGDAWDRFRLSGESALDLLAKGSRLDLDPRVFANGACALSSFAELRTLLHRSSDGAHFDLYCGRSYAQTLEEWLGEAAAEFGWEAPIDKGGAPANAAAQ
jgi:heterotetrameric sarcosine oxidase gamma subunit